MRWDFEPHVKEGDYEVAYFGHRFESKFGRPTLLLQFTIAQLTEHQNAILTKYFQLKKFNKKGGFSVKKTQEFARFWFSIFPTHDFSRMDRFPLSKLKGLVLLAVVKDRTHDFEQNEIPLPLRTSKIVKLKPL
ncbi:hypothetical protein [Marinicella litoralis]|uniref:Uncharacterized protein n=1 Tax=Marinicella litoralis TaxID=644220 RepID=A0A4R6XZC3_9GAMM|nr:hypothetical protein [Marinicella litoralis]TDR23900.1 hypothetical protein C8D91_0768 [Marinicella litoralis]